MKPILSLLILLLPAAASAQSITLGTPSALDFCKGGSITVPYSATGQFAVDNQFVLQISSDGFNSYTYIGVDSTKQGAITGVMNTPSDHWRVRVVSSDPFIASADNG